MAADGAIAAPGPSAPAALPESIRRAALAPLDAPGVLERVRADRPWLGTTSSGPRASLAPVAFSAAVLLLQLYTLAAPLGVVLAGKYVEAHRQAAVERVLAVGSALPGLGAAHNGALLGRFLVDALDVTRPATLHQIALLLATTSVVVLWDRLRLRATLWQAILLAIGGFAGVTLARALAGAVPEQALAEMVLLPLAVPSLLLTVWVAVRAGTRAAHRTGARALPAPRVAASGQGGGLYPGRWQQARSAATMGVPGALPPAAEAVDADRGSDAQKGASTDGR